MDMFNSLHSRLVKFRKGERERYEDLGGSSDIQSPPGQVEFQASAGLQATPTTPASTKSFPDDTFTVDQAVDAIGFGKFQIKLSLLTGLAWMADAMEMMILSILAPALHCDWKINGWQQALLTSVVFAGMMISSGIWGKICDKYGRKAELIMCSLFTFYFGMLSSLAPTFTWMLILRGLTGFGIGGVPQSVTLYAEFLPSQARAKCVVMIEIFWAFGACFIVVLSLFIMPTLGWRWLLAFAAMPLLIFTLACVWLPESARFDVARGRMDLALATLQRIAEDNGKPMPLGKLVDSHRNISSLQPVQRGQIKDLFTPDLRLTTGLLWFIWLANAFSYYGVVLMTTELFEAGDGCHGGLGENTGGKLHEPACFLQCKTLTHKDYTDLLWTTIAEFPGLFITLFIIEAMGRRKTMAFELIVFSFFVLLVNMCTSRVTLTFLLFVARAFISGAFQAAYVYTPEVYPTTTRAMGLGSCSGMARVGALITPFVAQVMLKESVYLAISIYGSVCVVAAVAALMLPIETKGREMKETHERKQTPVSDMPVERTMIH